MRQIFRTLPWIHPSEPEVLQTLYRKYGRKIHVKKGETLKSGGEAPVLFFLEKGLAAYWVNRTTPGHTAILSLIIPGRTMGNITCFFRRTRQRDVAHAAGFRRVDRQTQRPSRRVPA